MVAQLTNHETVDCAILGLFATENGGSPELDAFAGLQRKGALFALLEFEPVIFIGDQLTVRGASSPAAHPRETLFQNAMLAIAVTSIFLRCFFIDSPR